MGGHRGVHISNRLIISAQSRHQQDSPMLYLWLGGDMVAVGHVQWSALCCPRALPLPFIPCCMNPLVHSHSPTQRCITTHAHIYTAAWLVEHA